jgi:hypothetical protein
MRIAWLKAGSGKGGIRRGFERGRCPVCLGEEEAKHILLKCSVTKIGEENLSICRSDWTQMRT